MKLNNSANISKNRRKHLNKLSESSSKFQKKANKSSTNFKNKGKLSTINQESSDSSQSSDFRKKRDKNRNKSRNKKHNKKRSKKKDGYNNTKRSQSVKTFKHRNKNKMLRTTKDDIKKRNNKFFNRTFQSATYSLRNKKNFFFNKRSKTPNTESYANKILNYYKNKFLRTSKINSAYSSGFNKFKRISLDQINKKYRLLSELDEKNRKYFWLRYNSRRRDSDDRLKSLTFRKSKFSQNTSSIFNFKNNYLKEKEDGFYNRITLSPKIEENQFYKKKYLKGDDNPYSVKWPSHFLEIGYNSGFCYEDFQEGVPILRLRNLDNKIVLPPITSRYSKKFKKAIKFPFSNLNGLTREERINYILMAEQKKNDRNNVFISEKARKKLLEKFIIKKNKKNKE